MKFEEVLPALREGKKITTDVIKEMSLCKMIIARTDMPFHLQERAIKRIDELRKELNK